MKGSLAARLGVALVAASIGITLAPPSPTRAAVDIGYKDQSFSGAAGSPSGSKPESKLWWNDGFWWASMYDTASTDFHIFRLNLATQQWINTGTSLDDRPSSRADTLWDAATGKLYVASHVFVDGSSSSSTGKPARLYRFSYNTATKAYTLDSGFPVAINDVSSETLVIDKDTTGKLWATWMQQSTLFVNRTTTDDAHWGTPFVPSVAGTSAASDDISSVIAFGPGKIGVMWSNQNVSAMYFAYHVDGDADATWQATRTAVQGPNTADDHINLKSLQSDGSGRVYAAVKTSLTSSSAPLINLLVRDPGTGDWTSYRFGRVSDSHTRPIVMLDEEHGVIHMYATGPTPPNTSGQSGGTIYEKTTPINNISFADGYGTPVVQDASSSTINNVTSTKQNVNSTTGIVILATSDSTRLYYHNYISLGAPPAGPTADFVGSPTSGTGPLTVSFTDLSTGSPTSWSWNFGDPGSGSANTSTLQSPSHLYGSPGTYTVALTVTDANNASNTKTRTNYITVSPPAGSTLTLSPVADAQVSSTSPTANYGTLASMRTREGNGSNPATYRSYLKFDVQGLTGSVTGVTLRLYVTDKTGNTQGVYAVDPGWTETGLTYANAPAIGGTSLGGATAPTVNTYVQIPLATSGVPGNGIASFAVKSNGTDSAIYNTKEAGSNPPQLVITQSGGANTAPTANPTSATTAQDTPVAVALGGSDVETCELTFSIVTPPANGSLGSIGAAVCAAGSPNTDTASVTYTPNAGYTGPDSFTYKVNDGTADAPAATASLTVTQPNTAPTANAASATTAEDTPVVVGLAGSDPETCELTFSIVTPPTKGSLGSIGAAPCSAGSPNTDTASVTYTPNANATGADSFTYKVNDGTADSPAATASLTITPVNDPPTANPTSATTAQDTPVAVALGGSDVETCELTFSIVTPPANGSLGSIGAAVCAAGSPNTDTASVTYTPNAGYTGPDSFTYKVNDGTADAPAATASLTVTGSSPTMVTFAPSADAYVSSASTTNKGTLTTMWVREGNASNPTTYHSYMKFDVTGISGTVSSVKLRIFVTDPSPDGGGAYSVGNGWTETGILWSNAPPISGSALAQAGPVVLNTWVELDLGAGAVTGNGTYSFALKSASTDSAVYSTREGVSPPQLVITYTP